MPHDEERPTRMEADRNENGPDTWLSSSHLSMPNPCPHLSRIDVIRARLHSDTATLDHLENCNG